MKNLVKLYNLNPSTVANEMYDEETTKAINDLNMDLRYKNPEVVKNIALNIKLKSLAFSLAKQHQCQIQNKGSSSINNNNNINLDCKVKDHRIQWRDLLIL